MHLIVLTPAAQGASPNGAPQDLQALVERWNPLMTRLQPTWALQEHTESLHTLCERALGRLVLGRELQAVEDGRLPLQAWAEAGTTEPCARLTPFHGLVGSDRITLVPPVELELTEDESLALFAAVEPLFASEGVVVQWRAPLCWRVQHESLRHLACASLARAEGDSVQRWQGRTPLASARLLRRLQNEAQMVLHEHPVNQARAQRGALTINSLWMDHAGVPGGLAHEPAGPALGEALARVQVRPLSEANPALQGWVDAALPVPFQEEPTLVWCGRHAARAFQMRRLPGGWRGAIERTLKRPPPTRPLQAWLQALDAEPHAQAPA